MNAPVPHPSGVPSVLKILHKDGRPRFALWELTQRCPADCVHCYLGDRSDHSDLGREDCLTVLDRLRRAGILFLTLTGGEPTIHKHFFAVAEAAVRNNMAVSLFTAAYHLTRRQVERIVGLNLFKIEVSLLGEGHVHDTLMRRPGAFEKALHNIRAFRDAGIAVTIKTAMLAENVHHASGLRRLADDLGCEYKTDAGIIDRVDTNAPQALTAMTWEQKRDAVRIFEREMIERNVHHTRHEALLCGAGRTGFAISPGGDVFPCNTLRLPCGNLVTQPFEEVWESANMTALREYHEDDCTSCQSCGVMTRCKRCPGQAFMETGDFTERSRMDCDLASMRAEIHGDDVTRPFENEEHLPAATPLPTTTFSV